MRFTIKQAVFLFAVISQSWFVAHFCSPDIFQVPLYACELHNEVSKPMFVTMSVINFSIVFIFILWQLQYSINFLTATESFTYQSTIPSCCELEQSVTPSADIP